MDIVVEQYTDVELLLGDVLTDGTAVPSTLSIWRVRPLSSLGVVDDCMSFFVVFLWAFALTMLCSGRSMCGTRRDDDEVAVLRAEVSPMCSHSPKRISNASRNGLDVTHHVTIEQQKEEKHGKIEKHDMAVLHV